MKLLLLSLVVSNIFAGEIFNKKSIDETCSQETFIKTYKTIDNCKKMFNESNSKVKFSKTLSGTTMKELYDQEYDFMVKNKSPLLKVHPGIAFKIDNNGLTNINVMNSLFNSFKDKEYSKNYYTVYYVKDGKDLARGPKNSNELLKYISHYNEQHITEQLSLNKLTKSLNSDDETIKTYFYLGDKIDTNKIFYFEKKAAYYESLLNFRSKLIKPYLQTQFLKEKNPVLKITLFNCLYKSVIIETKGSSSIKKINNSDIHKELKEIQGTADLDKYINEYISKNSFINDYISGDLIEKEIIDFRLYYGSLKLLKDVKQN